MNNTFYKITSVTPTDRNMLLVLQNKKAKRG